MSRYTFHFLATGTLAATLAILSSCGDPEPSNPGDIDAAPSGADARVPDPIDSDTYAVVSTGEYRAVPAPACTDEFIDRNCDEFLPLQCEANEHADYDPSMICPVCAADSPADPSACDGWRYRYGDFLRHLISESCANWCDTDTDCVAWEINNACGSYALSLRALIDEEPIIFGEQFANDNCSVCGAMPQTAFLRRGGSSTIEGDGQHNGLLESYQPECRSNQCVLAVVE